MNKVNEYILDLVNGKLSENDKISQILRCYGSLSKMKNKNLSEEAYYSLIKLFLR